MTFKKKRKDNKLFITAHIQEYSTKNLFIKPKTDKKGYLYTTSEVPCARPLYMLDQQKVWL